MQDVNIVVVFCSQNGATEKLALAAAVGAVQGRANIRLRRIREAGAGRTAESERLDQDFVAPRAADLQWCDAVILGTPARLDAGCAEWSGFFDSLGSVGLPRKIGAAFASTPAEGGWLSLCTALLRLGLITVPQSGAPETEATRLLGRSVAELARALKRADAGTRV
ncbi:MAG TPA: hypothetical protein VJ732_17790 [Bryobacteraceae bacterium]|nr:hypothetical protein [Bryobacteraceae bacterium]